MIDEHILDANVFISAKNFYYDMIFCPAFWDWLIDARNANSVFSIEAVSIELCRGKDELARWVQGSGACLFLPHDQGMTSKFGDVSSWADAQKHYKQAAVSAFLGSADYYLIAHALAHGRTLVTHEKSEPNCKTKIKIPDACLGLGVKCITPFEMIRTSGARFVLQR